MNAWNQDRKLGLRRRRSQGFFGDLELQAGADAGGDDRDSDVRNRSELDVFDLGPQEKVLRQRPVEPRPPAQLPRKVGCRSGGSRSDGDGELGKRRCTSELEARTGAGADDVN